MSQSTAPFPLLSGLNLSVWLPSRLDLQRLDSPLVYVFAAFLCVVLEGVPAFDQAAQAPFFSNNGWLISDAMHSTWKLWLYTAPKIGIGCVGAVVFAVFVYARFAKNGAALLHWERPCLVLALTIALVPALVGLLKVLTGVHVPMDLVYYGGEHPHIGFLEQLWLYGQTAGGRGFPAGHASGGFALMALSCLPVGRRARYWLLAFGLTCGWLMGLYQMARGEHFLTHTLTCMFLALVVIRLLQRVVRPEVSAHICKCYKM